MKNRLISGAVMLLLALSVQAAEPASNGVRRSVFAMPRVQAFLALQQQETLALFQLGRYEDAEKACLASIQASPDVPTSYYNLACSQARLGKVDAAFESLTLAVEKGFNDANVIKGDADLESLHTDKRYAGIVKAAEKAGPYQPERRTIVATEPSNGVVWVSEINTAWNSMTGLLQCYFKFPPELAESNKVVTGEGEIEKLIRRWYVEGTASGNYGDLYDNRDGGHSDLNMSRFPQLTRIKYAPEASSNGVERGLQSQILHNCVTMGNASVANTGGLYWRSMPRYAYPDARGMLVLFAQYAASHVYMYPEHRDYKPGHNGDGGYGDVYCANTPYVIISQGSSGTDQPFMNAVVLTLASFRPQVKEMLVRNGALMPAIQMIFRSSNKMVAAPADYLTGIAHPPVFDGSQVDALKMVQMAHDMTTNCVPPLIHLEVVEEDIPDAGRDFFDARPTERLADTPSAVARLVRSTKYVRRMVVTSEGSKDLNGLPLTYQWRVLRGDADRIKINPLNKDGSKVELLVPYHERRPIQPGSAMEGNRVDIGAFVNNGKYYSAPGFVTFFYLDNEKRVYNAGNQIVSVQYSGGETTGNYVDPMIDLPKDWRDEYQYNAKGRLLGWTRTLGATKQEFTADGKLIVSRDEDGKPKETREVRYMAKRLKDGRLMLEQQTVDPAAAKTAMAPAAKAETDGGH